MAKPTKDKYFSLFANCIPIAGWTRTTIYDLQMNRYKTVPLFLQNILISSKSKPLKALLQSLKVNERKYVLEYIELLVEEGFGFFTNNPESFPDLPLDWDRPTIISSAIIDCTGQKINTPRIGELITKLYCEVVQIYIKDNFTGLEELLTGLDNSWVKSIEIFTEFNSNNDEIIAICNKHDRVSVVHFMQSPEGYKYEGKSSYKVIYDEIKEDIHSLLNNAEERKMFILNISFFTESLKYNPYFNRKIYIQSDGAIRNALESDKIIGDINKQSTSQLIKEIKKKTNQKYWYAHKGITDVCKDCEFRNMCFDNRLPEKRKDGSWFHKSECDYNPYIGKWKGEEGYRTLNESSITSSKTGFSIDYDKVNKINQELWG